MIGPNGFPVWPWYDVIGRFRNFLAWRFPDEGTLEYRVRDWTSQRAADLGDVFIDLDCRLNKMRTGHYDPSSDRGFFKDRALWAWGWSSTLDPNDYPDIETGW